MAFPVQIYVYEFSKGFCRTFSGPLLGTEIEGMWHTGIVVYGREYYFGVGGICFVEPGKLFLGKPDEIIDVGSTDVTQAEFEEYLLELNDGPFGGDEYHVLLHNCNTFSNVAARFLTGQRIPAKIAEHPALFLTTRVGTKVKPIVDNVMYGINTGVKFGTTALVMLAWSFPRLSGCEKKMFSGRSILEIRKERRLLTAALAKAEKAELLQFPAAEIPAVGILERRASI